MEIVSDCRNQKIIKSNAGLCQMYTISFVKKIPTIDVEINQNLDQNQMVKVDITNVKKKSKIVRKNKKVYAKKEQSTTAKMLAL